MVYFGLAAHNADATSHLANGMAVAVKDVPPNDIADALDMHIWKFDVVMPDTKHFCMVTLNAYSQGKFVRTLAGGGSGANQRDYHLTVSLTPIDGDLYTAKRVRCVINFGGGAASAFFPNPFLNRKSIAIGPYVSEAGNRVYLMGGGKQAHSPAGSNDLDIALDIKPGPLIPNFPSPQKQP